MTIKYRVISETNGVGELKVFVEEGRKVAAFLGFSRVKWTRLRRLGRLSCWEDEVFSSTREAKNYLDALIATRALTTARFTVVLRTVKAHP